MCISRSMVISWPSRVWLALCVHLRVSWRHCRPSSKPNSTRRQSLNARRWHHMQHLLCLRSDTRICAGWSRCWTPCCCTREAIHGRLPSSVSRTTGCPFH
ncbi:hypothetical protein BC831DRAFT_138541 [Entophlyctis helioformis]|nr:hypothetical protein BC831DRAFT_138541 [Entophlyctis helioformis]